VPFAVKRLIFNRKDHQESRDGRKGSVGRCKTALELCKPSVEMCLGALEMDKRALERRESVLESDFDTVERL
jgi:hypothetical protein